MASQGTPQAKAVQEYLDKYNVTEKLNVAVNDLCKAKPEDPFAFLAQRLGAFFNAPSIEKLVGREILDSRGNPTVQVDCYCKVESSVRMVARGDAPSGASTGSNEAHELRDGDQSRYLGKGTTQAVNNVNTMLSPALAGVNPCDLAIADEIMCKTDGTELKTKVGGNAITAASFAIAIAGAQLLRKELFLHLAQVFHGDQMPSQFRLPTPMVNILNGGKHAGGNLKIQEFMIMPKKGIPFRQALCDVATVYHHLGKLLVKNHGVSAKNLGDEGGFAPALDDAEQALSAIEEAIQAAGFTVGTDITLALDSAASEFYDRERGQYEISNGQWLSSEEMVDYYASMVERHPALQSIEDGLDEKDYEGWKKLTARLGDKVMLVGDDLFTTNTNLLSRGVEEKWCNALLLKVNQIGTVSEGMAAARMSFTNNYNVAVSHRSGETTGSVIADLAVGIGAQYIKTGATARGERIAKYNRLLQIEEYLRENNMLAQ